MQAFGPHRFGEFCNHVAMWTHFRRRPVAQATVVHGKAIMMFGNGNDVLRSCFPEELGPRPGIEMFRLEHRYEVFVSEFVLRTIGGEMVCILLLPGDVHAAGIPFIPEGGHRIARPSE